MGAPKLLDKRTVTAEVATQKAQSIREGLNLAKKVDVLRETLGQEEANLERFRHEAITRVQNGIDAKLAEHETLTNENKFLTHENEILRAEWIRLQSPPDLLEERSKVKAESLENEAWNARIVVREADCKSVEHSLSKRDSALTQKENLTERTLIEAESKFEESSKGLEIAQTKAKTLVESAKKREQDVSTREQEVSLWNDDLKTLESELKEKEIDLFNRERALKDKYETLIRTQERIKHDNSTH